MLSVLVNLGTLGFFKYYMFAMGGVNALVELFGGEPYTVLRVLLPVGISFYTFQAMSYTIDVWRGDAPPVKNFATFACYVALFPQLVAGPIVRYNTVADELETREHTAENWMRGITFFCLGFAKKILIANQVGAIADRVLEAADPGVVNSWWGSIAYMMQIYFDFSAYSDMAVGLGLMLGFHFPRNFNGPYRSASISEFDIGYVVSLTVPDSIGGVFTDPSGKKYSNCVVIYRTRARYYVEDRIKGTMYLDDQYSAAYCTYHVHLNIPEGVCYTLED